MQDLEIQKEVMADGNPDSGRHNDNFRRGSRGGMFFVTSGLVILALVAAFITLDLSGHRLTFVPGGIEISAKVE